MLKQVLVVVAISASVYWATSFVNLMGYFRKTYNHAPGSCHRVTPIEYGSEDMQVLPSGIALITSGLRLGNTEVYTKRPGRIYLFDFNKPNEAAKEVRISADSSFQLISPHGLNIWTDPVTGTIFVYVVSHQAASEIVDKFSFDESTHILTHIKRITGDSNFHQLNDVVVVGEDQFYFTNCLYSKSQLELLLGLRWGSIGFYNGTGSKLLDTGLFIPNGVILSRDNKYLYLAQCGDENVLVYSRRDDNTLSFEYALQIDSAVDNLNLDSSTGDVLVGSHPVLHKVLAYMENPGNVSPSHVIRIKMDDNSRVLGVEEIYSNDGTEISGSTVAVIHGRGMLIGSVASNMLYCEIK